MKITTVGIDLAKNVFQVHGIDEHGKTVLKKQLRRDQIAAFFVNLPPCLIGIEACGSAQRMGRSLLRLRGTRNVAPTRAAASLRGVGAAGLSRAATMLAATRALGW